MANLEHLNLLRQGPAVWNAKRPRYPQSGSQPVIRTETGRALRVQVLDIKGNPVESGRIRPEFSSDFEPKLLVDLTGADLKGLRMEGLDLSDADLSGADLRGAYLLDADLRRSKLVNAECTGKSTSFNGSNFFESNCQGGRFAESFLGNSNFNRADFRSAEMAGANLAYSSFWGADFRKCDLRAANLSASTMDDADLRDARLEAANLGGVRFMKTKLQGANLTGASVYGSSAWDIVGSPIAKDLVITPGSKPLVTVDDLDVAQFVYLLLNSDKLQGIIGTLAKKGVLILGSFRTPERKAVLDAIREELRKKDCVPMMFDFSLPAGGGYGQTVTLLARMAKYVIADITDAAEIRSELLQIVQQLPRLPVKPILLDGYPIYSTFYTDIAAYRHTVLPIYSYQSVRELIANLDSEVISDADERWKLLTGRDD